MNTYDELFEQMNIIRKMHENFREFARVAYKQENIEDLKKLSQEHYFECEFKRCARVNKVKC